MANLTARQKQIFMGGLLLAFGVATGVVVSPDDPQRDDKLAEVGSAFGSAVGDPTKPIDTTEYNRVVGPLRAGSARENRVDMLTEPAAPGALVVATVNMRLGARPATVEYTGQADGAFDTVSLTFEDVPASTDAGIGHTTFRLTATAKATNSGPIRLTAFVHVVP